MMHEFWVSAPALSILFFYTQYSYL